MNGSYALAANNQISLTTQIPWPWAFPPTFHGPYPYSLTFPGYQKFQKSGNPVIYVQVCQKLARSPQRTCKHIQGEQKYFPKIFLHFSQRSFGWSKQNFISYMTDWLEFNGTFSTVRLYRVFRSYSLRFGKLKHPGSLVNTSHIQ